MPAYWNKNNLRPAGETVKTPKGFRETERDRFGVVFSVFPPASSKDRHGIRVEMFGETVKDICNRLVKETDGVLYKIEDVTEYAHG